MGDKENLHRYLVQARDDLVGKLDGLSEYDVRRPLTPTGTNLLGLVKHVAFTQLGYLTEVFGRPSGLDYPEEAPDDDMWAKSGETREQVLGWFRLSAQRADETVAELPLDAPGLVPWWGPERGKVTLQQVLVHLVAEVARHAGHADILREQIDGGAGRRAGDPSLPGRTDEEWAAYREKIEAAAVGYR
ncbi:MAG TPA: DinB family protein [Friedmanniella sp.]